MICVLLIHKCLFSLFKWILDSKMFLLNLQELILVIYKLLVKRKMNNQKRIKRKLQKQEQSAMLKKPKDVEQKKNLNFHLKKNKSFNVLKMPKQRSLREMNFIKRKISQKHLNFIMKQSH